MRSVVCRVSLSRRRWWWKEEEKECHGYSAHLGQTDDEEKVWKGKAGLRQQPGKTGSECICKQSSLIGQLLLATLSHSHINVTKLEKTYNHIGICSNSRLLLQNI